MPAKLALEISDIADIGRNYRIPFGQSGLQTACN
jgi:hypothetical protein